MSEENAPDFQVTFAEARVLGSLMEKEATTPDNYPMSLNGLQSACNQKTSREPVVEFDEATVERALEGLRSKHLATKQHMAGSRVPKYKHSLDQVLNLDPGPAALLCVLLLRGPQTAGELNQRTERIHTFASVEAVEEAMNALIEYPTGALARKLPAGGGRRVATFVHLLSGEPTEQMLSVGTSSPAAVQQIILEEEASWRKKLEDEVASLRGELKALQETFEEFKRQFE